MLKKQNKYEVLTSLGWKDFSGIIQKKSTCGMLSIETTKGYTLSCTLDHQLELNDGSFKEAIELEENDYIKIFEYTDSIKSIQYTAENAYVYDLLEVKDTHSYFTNGFISHNCSFVGSVDTLISGQSLTNLSFITPIAKAENISQYVIPIEKHIYAMIVDVSRGKGLDYSTFSIMDVTTMPYMQVCTFRDNFISPADYASILYRMAKLYNEAYVLIEINDIGGQVSDTLFMEFGYENMLFTESGGRSGKRISGGFSSNVDRGIRTTKSVKSIGCSILKLLIEQTQLIINDADTIYELGRFSKKGSSYEAESGSHDDMVMTLVLFAWLCDQNYFKEISDINTIMKLREKTEQEINDNLMPFGFIIDGHEDTIDLARELGSSIKYE